MYLSVEMRSVNTRPMAEDTHIACVEQGDDSGRLHY